MDILEKLFDNSARVKLLRLFLFNPGVAFGRPDIVVKSKVTRSRLSGELNLLKKVGLIKQRKLRAKDDFGKAGSIGFELDPKFPLTYSLRNLLNQDFLRRRADVTKRFKNCGRLKLIVVSGIFLDNEDCRIDLFVVGDKLKKRAIDNIVKTIEADIGREMVYAALETDDFTYRLNSSDKFIRDVFDYPHEKLLDKMGV